MPEQRKTRRRRHIPAELVEIIALNLPVKSLLRFSTVSKSWNTMILGGGGWFARRYRGREMLALKLYSDIGEGARHVAFPISALSTAAPLPLPPLPFDGDPYTEVSCGALRCVAAGDTLRLYNPSTGAHRQLPAPRCPPRIGSTVAGGLTKVSVHVYGLGHDPAGDYKIVKSHLELFGETEVYSLNDDAWRVVSDSKRKIQLCLGSDAIRFITRKGVFVSGALHWLVSHRRFSDGGGGVDVLTFDVSAESYGKVVAPPLPAELFQPYQCSTINLDVCLLRGRLAFCSNHCYRFVVWVMEEDGVWKKDMAIDYTRIQPLCYSYLKPLYFCDGGGTVVKAVITPTQINKLYLYKQEDGGSSSLVEESFGTKGYGSLHTFTYFESLVSP